MIYDTSIDHIIVVELKNGKKHTGYLLRAINKIRLADGKKEITNETLDKHLVKLKDQGIIGRNDPQPAGYRRYCWLLNARETEIKLGFELVTTKRNERHSLKETQEKKITRAVILLLSIAATDSVRFKPVSKAEPGDFVVTNPTTGKPETVSLYTIPGVSAEDVANHEINDYSKKFSYTGLSEQEIRQCLQTLAEAGIMVKAHQTEGKTFYEITDEQLRNYVLFCHMLLQNVIPRMERTWACIREPHAKHGQEEIRWYYDVVGEEQAKHFFLNDKDELKNSKLLQIYTFLENYFEGKELANKEKLFEKIAKEIAKDNIRTLDSIILSEKNNLDEQYHTIINDQSYENEKSKYNLIFSIMTKLVYPKFLKKLHDHKRL